MKALAEKLDLAPFTADGHVFHSPSSRKKAFINSAVPHDFHSVYQACSLKRSGNSTAVPGLGIICNYPLLSNRSLHVSSLSLVILYYQVVYNNTYCDANQISTL